MGKSYIHFNRRNILLDFPDDPKDEWYTEDQKGLEGFEIPKYHTTRAIIGPAKEIEPGDTIWLIGQLYSPEDLPSWGNLPPALDGRIVVESVKKRKQGEKGFKYIAHDSSRWFPLADITPVLLKLQSLTKNGQINPVWKNENQPIGQSLRQIRRLLSDEPLRAWEEELNNKPLHFISYRHLDGTEAAFNKAKSLITEGIPMFWDRWSLPRRLAERNENVPNRALNKTIKNGINEAAVVWGIQSEKYGEPKSYSAKEKRLALEQKKYEPVILPNTKKK